MELEGSTKSAEEKEKAAEAQMKAAEKREQEAVASKAEAEAAKAEANRKGTEAERMVRDLEAKEALSRREAQAKLERYWSYSWSIPRARAFDANEEEMLGVPRSTCGDSL